MNNITKIIFIIFALLNIIIGAQSVYYFEVEKKEKILPFGLSTKVPANNPVVALALSGGGARGLAQIGVLKSLVENNIHPNIIVGTSIGAIVGGLYASGYSVDKLQQIAKQTNWLNLLTLSNKGTRKDLFIDQKLKQDRSILTLRLDGFRPVIPTSFNDGQELSNYLNVLTFNAPLNEYENYDRLKSKFRAVCTDLVTGNVVVLKKGSLSKALRASSSVTFFLAPVEYDSLLLVDGGLVANIPIDIARDENPDIVIAVDVTSPLWNEFDLQYPWVVADQIVSIPIKKLNEKQLLNADFVIVPELNNNYTSTNFQSVDSLILLGYKSSNEVVESIKKKINDIYINKISNEKFFFKNVIFDNSFDSTELKFFKHLSEKDSICNIDIQISLDNLFATGYYEDIKLNVLVDSNKSVFSLIKKENPIVKNLMLIGVSKINNSDISQIFNEIRYRPYNVIKLSEALQQLLLIYKQEGLSLAKVQEIRFEEEQQKLFLFIDEGIISKIVVTGNHNTDEDVIIRELEIEPGEFFNIADVEKGLRNLRSTGLFDFVEITVKEENGENFLNIIVEEKHTGLIRLFNRIDNEYKFQFGFDIREENLLGTGSELGISFFSGIRNRTVSIDQKSNRIFNTYLTYKLSAFHSFQDIYTYHTVPISESRFSRMINGEYRQINYGFSISIGSQVEKFGNLIFESKYQIDEIKNLSNIIVVPYKIKYFSFKVSSTVDTQDKFPFPDQGIFLNSYYETAQSFLTSDIGYTTFFINYKNYVPILTDLVFSSNIKWGFADKTFPLSQHFSLGGQNSFWGLRESEFRGRQIFTTSFSYRYKFPFKIFFPTFLMIRYDLGNVWEVQEQIRFKDLKHGIGSSLSFDTPIGPAEFSVGRSFLIKKVLTENKISWGDLLFYFSIGYYY